MTRGIRGLAAALVLLVASGAHAPTAAATGGGDRQAPPELVLTDQTTLVPPGGAFEVSVLAAGLPGATSVRVSLHDRIRSRSELAGANRGSPPSAVVRTSTAALADLPAAPDGSRRASLALAEAGGRTVDTPGVYPVEVAALGADGAVLDQLVTDLVVRPPASDANPPLSVAVLAHFGAGTSRSPDPEEATALATALSGAADVRATLAVSPALLHDLTTSTDPVDVALVAALRSAAADHPVLTLPYVATSPDALTKARLADELPRQLDAGTGVLREALGVTPDQTTWLAGSDLGGDGLRLLSALGIHGALVAPSQVERVLDGVLSPARPFVLAPPKQGTRRPAGPADPVQALLTDARLHDVLAADEEPALVAAHAVAELAMLWFEQPGTRRSVVLPVDPSIDGTAVQRVLEALRSTELFRAVGVDDAFDVAAPLEAAGDPLRRSLAPKGDSDLPAGVAAGIRSLRSTRASLAGMVGDDPSILAPVDDHLLRAMATGLSSAGRRREITEGRAAVASIVDKISTPDAVTITLTARDGTVPLTIRNDTGGPLEVRLRFSSAKLELPEGDTRTVTLTEQTTRLDIAVRTRTSGAFPFAVDITTPDGSVKLASTRYSVRSTAVSGVGLLLSIGAGLFLVIWWARHWREHRRSTKLVTDPPGHG